jgi:hypothetical protein
MNQPKSRHFSAQTGLMLACLVFQSLAGPVMAQQMVQAGKFEIHYNTFNTSQLTPEVARAYEIQRSGNRALLNIAVLETAEEGLNRAVSAQVTASAINLAGQRRVIDMREIRDQDAIYYIGTFRIHNDESLNFTIEVRPEGGGRAHEFSFRQQFFTD